MKKLLVLGICLLAASPALASFAVPIQSGPINSTGPVGDAGNGFFTYAYGGPDFQLGTITLDADLTSGGVGSWLSEARWHITGPNGISADFQYASGYTWSGTVHINNTLSSGGVWGTAMTGTWRFEAWESYNDPGLDAWWNNVAFTFNDYVPPQPPSSTYLGVAGVGGDSIDMNSFGSDFDTMIGLFDSTGNLLGVSDDAGGTLQSQLVQNLAEGRYYLALGKYYSSFANGWSVTPNSSPGGNYVISVTGSLGALGTSGTYAGTTVWTSFDIIPEPGTLALLGLGLIGLIRRR